MFRRGIAGLVGLVCLAAAAPAQGAGTTGPDLRLLSASPYTSDARSVRLADLNGDRLDDYVLGSACSLTALLGTADGAYGNTGSMQIQWRPLPTVGGGCDNTTGALAVGDVTGDGKPDVLFARANEALLWVYAGRGDGTFQSPQSFLTPAAPAELVAGDLNGDDRADVVLRTANGIVAITSSGAGFNAPATYSTGGRAPLALATGHTDDGATLDVVVGTATGVLNFTGNGDGTLAAGQFIGTDVTGDKVVTARLRADVNRDDVLVTGSAGVQTVYTGPGGALTAAVTDSNSQGGQTAVADFDRDGRMDTVTLSGVSIKATFRLGDGAGGLGNARGWVYPFEPGPVTDLAVQDANRDGFMDAVVVTGGRLGFLHNLPKAQVEDNDGTDFEPTTVGAQSAPRTIRYFNSTIRPVTITAVSGPAEIAPAFFVTADGCSAKTLPVGGSCSITVVFRPVQPGLASSSIWIDGPDGGLGAKVSGWGVAAPPTAVPTDKTAPTVTGKVAKQKLKTVLSRGLKVSAACNETPCTVKASLRLKGKEVAKGTSTGKALTLKLSAKAKKALRKARSAKFTLRLTATDAAGNARTTTKTITVRQPRG